MYDSPGEAGVCDEIWRLDWSAVQGSCCNSIEHILRVNRFSKIICGNGCRIQ